MPSGLMHGFMRLFIYAHGSSVATNAVQRLLSPTDGPFRNSAFLQSEQGTRFIHHLAEANPGMTLRLLELTFGTWSLEHLRSWQTGRQNVVWALEKIAVWRELFPRAARLLSNIALAENSNNANNSRGVLKALFAIGPEWAPTEAAPSDRFQILEGLIRSHDTNERSLGLELCKQWLSTRGPMRVIGVEYQGLKPTVRFWTPKTYGEWFDEWKRVWRFVCDEMRGWPSVEKRRGASLLINGASGLVQYKAISGEVLDTLFELADDPDVDHKELVHFVIHIKRYQPQGFPKRAASRIERLDKKLTGSSLWDRIRRYVLFTDWGEDYDFVNGKAEKIDLVGERIRTLAEELAADDELLRTLVPRLVCSDGIKLGQFGFDVASANINSQLDELVIQIITDSMPCVNGQFVSGYVRGLRKFDQIRSDNVELRLLSEASTRMIGVDCASRCGATVSVLKKLLDLHKSGHVPSWAFHRVGLTATEFGVPKSLVDQVARALKNRPDDHSTETCIELIDHFYLRDGNRDKMPKALIFSILTSEAFLGRGEHPGGFSWHRVATRFLEQNPDHELDLFSFMIENQPQFPAMRAMNYRSQLADGIVVRRPKDTWTIVAKNLESESANAWHLRQWLGDNGSEDHPELGAIRYFAPDDVMSWMRKKPTARLPILGDVLPKTLDAAHGGKLTQMFIEQYGDDKDVSSRLVSRFWLGGWSGSESLYFSRLRDKARQWYAEISSPKVRRWLAGYIEFLNNGIEEARIKEERDF